ncbi:hypothetical protein BBF96_06360 [Anoxybacter fermentans]|uniref:Amidohydrolase-related domain-containing protein n=2 Tax=Anoxybacter fermentans TaxID=1323375 RepID=A0A3Q9HSX6_9FIRM|nr:hypothetical protein BBF96_06360 [Anoxybacter fermentans]
MQFHEGQQIWIEDGIIKNIGKGFDKPGREVIDLQRMLVLPGWIDAHLHLTLTGEADPISQWQQDGVVITAIKAVTYLKKHLQAGVTVLRDLGGDCDIVLELKKAQKAGLVEGPEIYTSGKALTMTGGHIYQISKEVDGPDIARKGAREELKKGVDLLKVIATGGILTQGVKPGSPQLNEDEIRAIVEEAHKAKRRVSAHVEGKEGIMNALRAGVDTLEHGIGLDLEAVEMIKNKSVVLIPTLAAPRLILRHREELPIEMVKKAEEVVEEHKHSFALAYKKGCKIAVGTDAGTPFNHHGKYYIELAEMLADGMKIEEVLQVASLNGAVALGIDDRCGNIEVGKIANLTIIDDCLDDREWYRNVRMVMYYGKLIRII